MDHPCSILVPKSHSCSILVPILSYVGLVHFHTCSFELSANIILLPRRNQYILIVRNICPSLFSQLFSFLFHSCSNSDSIPIHACSILVPCLCHACSMLAPCLFTYVSTYTKEFYLNSCILNLKLLYVHR